MWETPEHLLQGRAIGTDGALGPRSILVQQECFAPVLSSDGQGQLLLSYSKYGEQSQTRRVFSRLVGRGAVNPDGGVGGRRALAVRQVPTPAVAEAAPGARGPA